MADISLQAESVCANPDDRCHVLYFAYRHAKAAWEVQLYAPEMLDEDLPAEIGDPLSDAHDKALNAYLLEPAHSLRELARKLRTFHEEEIQHCAIANEAVSALATDAQRLCRASI